VTTLGMAAGLVLAYILARASSSLLVGISPGDPATFLTVSTIVVAVAILASWSPALRAMRVDPARSLRSD
jgi:ABC-type antimicrobial peptide transport system permease subunit